MSSTHMSQQQLTARRIEVRMVLPSEEAVSAAEEHRGGKSQGAGELGT